MKFTEGYWLRSERANGLFATQAYAVDKIPGGMRIVAPTGAINHRGDTLNADDYDRIQGMRCRDDFRAGMAL